MQLSAHDIEIWAKTVYGEARGESGAARQLMAWTIRNRAVQRYRGDSIAACAQWHAQYSCWNAADPNYRLVCDVSLDDPIFRYCMLSALLVVDAEQKSDPTHGARHYHTTDKPSWAKTWPPIWAVDHTPCATIGRHQFYNDVA